jgi:hypothetical protein
VVAQVIEDLEVPWREDELDAVLDRLRFNWSRRILGCRIQLLHVLSLTEDVIPAPGKWIFT